jgi:GNAT superfamily N-acetyltransferase
MTTALQRRDLEIRVHAPGGDVGPFLRAGHAVLGDDPAWVAPLDFEMKERLHPKKNPFFEHGEVALFTAWRGGVPVGRISATVDRGWLDYWKDDTGFFGFFDTRDDEEVASALLSRAEAWLRERGIQRVLGPASLHANDELGLLVDGFEHPPSMMMPHSRVWQAALLEGEGYVKEKDLYAWRYRADRPFSERTLAAWRRVKEELPEVTLRSLDLRRFREEVGLVIDIYNEAWGGKWGYLPFTKPELEKLASDLRLILDPDIAFIAEVDGEPMGMCVMVPNLNEAARDLRGRLFPTGWMRLLWRLKVRGVGSTRLILLGIRKALRQNVKRYGGLSAAMYVEVAKRAQAKGYRWGELSWTREDDAPINAGIRSMGAERYKTYRVFTKAL